MVKLTIFLCTELLFCRFCTAPVLCKGCNLPRRQIGGWAFLVQIAAVKDAVVRNGAVYLAALGGAGALMAKSVQTLEVIAWPDLGCEAVRRLTVQDMPLTVVLDAHGGDLYETGPAAYLAAL